MLMKWNSKKAKISLFVNIYYVNQKNGKLLKIQIKHPRIDFERLLSHFTPSIR